MANLVQEYLERDLVDRPHELIRSPVLVRWIDRSDRVATHLERLQTMPERGLLQFALASRLAVHKEFERATTLHRAVRSEHRLHRHLALGDDFGALNGHFAMSAK